MYVLGKDSEMKKIYVSGKMTGLVDMGRCFFESGVEEVEASGCVALNPHDVVVEDGAGWREYMEADLIELGKCDGIYMLWNWRDSAGACVERRYAKNHGIKVYYELNPYVY